MKILIKPLAHSNFTVEIEPDQTVRELKEKIESQQGKEYPSKAQKLIYSGKILADEKKVSEYNFDEKKFVVLMITRPPPAPKPAEQPARSETTTTTTPKSTPATTATATPAATTTSLDDRAKNKPSIATASHSSTVSNSQPSAAPSTTSTASSNTASSGAPTNAPTPQQQQHTTTTSRPSATPQRATTETSAPHLGEPQVAARLAALMSQPHFRQIQDLIQQSPHLLSTTIESLAASDPEMYSFISDNPDVFVSALNHPPLPSARRTTQQSSSVGQVEHAGGGGSQSGAGVVSGRQQPVVDQILVSEHDKEAIERLKELGFSEYLAVQAYMACDKDEQLAANLLFQMDQ